MGFFQSKWFPLSLLGVLGVFGLVRAAQVGAVEAELLAVAP